MRRDLTICLLYGINGRSILTYNSILLIVPPYSYCKYGRKEIEEKNDYAKSQTHTLTLMINIIPVHHTSAYNIHHTIPVTSLIQNGSLRIRKEKTKYVNFNWLPYKMRFLSFFLSYLKKNGKKRI